MRKLVRIAFLKKFRSEMLVQNDGYTVVGLDLENFRLGRVDETFVTTSSSMSSGKLGYWIKYRGRNTIVIGEDNCLELRQSNICV